ncbi:MAG: right-handed parallel beta-helix repeat-containing protein [Candidatus Bathyarchaeota archaeon]|nr:MAG: right-handed parallel beta-helix repeat-containing protein [Candidatus Bathyarchaeota archaeon]
MVFRLRLIAVSIMASMLILACILTWIFVLQPVKANPGTIYIRADGSVDPSTANITSSDNVTYTFTDDISDSLVIERGNTTIDGAGYKLQGTGGGTGIQIWVFAWEENVTIKNLEIASFSTGISLTNTGNITVSGTKIRNCSRGIAFGESFNNIISGNIIVNNTDGIGGSTSMETVISENIIANNTNGILFSWAQNNTIYLNNVTNNEYAIYMVGWSVYNNTFYHNNFINNTNQVYIEQPNPNVWDDDYPSGGNFWDDFPDLYPLVGDDYSGSDQNETGSDGMWDSSYEIYGNNTDRYPLTTVIPEFPTWASIAPALVIFTVAVIIVKNRRINTPIH